MRNKKEYCQSSHWVAIHSCQKSIHCMFSIWIERLDTSSTMYNCILMNVTNFFHLFHIAACNIFIQSFSSSPSFQSIFILSFCKKTIGNIVAKKKKKTMMDDRSELLDQLLYFFFHSWQLWKKSNKIFANWYWHCFDFGWSFSYCLLYWSMNEWMHFSILFVIFDTRDTQRRQKKCLYVISLLVDLNGNDFKWSEHLNWFGSWE